MTDSKSVGSDVDPTMDLKNATMLIPSFVEWDIYLNIRTYMALNGIKPIEGHKYGYADVMKMIRSDQYVMIKGQITQDANIPYYMFIFGAGSHNDATSAFGMIAGHIATAMSHIDKADKKVRIMFISRTMPKSNVIRAIQRHKEKQETSFTYRIIPHHVFQIDRTVARLPTSDGSSAESDGVCEEYSIVPHGELPALQKDLMVDLANMQKISHNDPNVVWRMGRIGQVVKIITHSRNSTTTVNYRVVVKVAGV